MVVREDSAAARQAVGYGRHGRPKPVGGRFRLPGIRFSGAAMAMSTVVGISIATTWLLNEQQHIGPRPDISSVGASPPLPSADDSTPAPEPAASVHPILPPSVQAVGTPEVRPVRAGRPSGSAPAPSPTSPGPSPSAGSPQPSSTGSQPLPNGSQPPTAAASGPAKAARPGAPGKPTTSPCTPLKGEAVREQVGPSGTRHTLALHVGEAVTALQVEFRLARPEALPGTAPWSNLPGAVVTVAQERDTLVYRFTVPAGLDVQPGAYTFGVRGARLPAEGWADAPQESWAASAFALQNPRALAVRGTFDQDRPV